LPFLLVVLFARCLFDSYFFESSPSLHLAPPNHLTLCYPPVSSPHSFTSATTRKNSPNSPPIPRAPNVVSPVFFPSDLRLAFTQPPNQIPAPQPPPIPQKNTTSRKAATPPFPATRTTPCPFLPVSRFDLEELLRMCPLFLQPPALFFF